MSLSQIGRLPQIDLEHVIRPFGASPVQSSRVRRTTQSGTQSSGSNQNTDGEDIPTLTWSARADVEVVTLEARGYKINWNDTPEDLFEISRTTHTIRVENPDDPDQYVDVEVVDTVDLRDAANAIRKFNFENES